MKWLVVNRFFRLKIRNLCDQTSGANIEIVTEIKQRLTQENLETDASGHEATPVTRKIQIQRTALDHCICIS